MEIPKTAQDAEEQFFLEYFNTDRVFKSIRRADYLFLCAIRANAGKRGRPGRTYLADLSRELDIPVPTLSRTVERLQDKGFVTWKTDPAAGRTYVKLTSKAVELMEDERARMRDAYRRITDEIDPKELDRAMDVVRRITAILRDTGSAG